MAGAFGRRFRVFVRSVRIRRGRRAESALRPPVPTRDVTDLAAHHYGVTVTDLETAVASS
jgi:hypothetical protein